MPLTTKQILSIVETHQRKSEKDRRAWDKHRAWYLSEYWGGGEEIPTGAGEATDEDEVNFETNYLYAFTDTMIANICPTNPQVTVRARQEKLRNAAKLREALINEMFRQNDLHAKLWKTSTNAAITGRGWLKTIWDFRKERAIVRVIDPRFVWYDQSVDFEDTRYLIEVTVLTRDEMQARIKKPGPKKGQHYASKVAEKAIYGGYPAWLRDKVRDESMIDSGSREVFEWVVVYEFYDFVGGKFYHLLEGVEEPLFEGDLPYRYLKNPFRLLTFNDNMSDSGGISDAKLVSGNIDRLNEIDTLELWHAHSTIPVAVVDKSKLDNAGDFLDMLRNVNRPGMAALVELANGVRLSDVMGHTPVPPFTPQFGEMRQRAIDTIEFVLGIPAYSRGKVGVTDVATEAALADTAVRTRNGRRIKAVLDIVVGIGEDIMALYEEFMPSDRPLSIRLINTEQVLKVDRAGAGIKNGDTGASPLEYDYDAVAYSPTENHRLLMLEKLRQYMPMLAQSPSVDPMKLMRELLELLQMPDIMVDPQAQAQLQAQAAAPPGAPGLPPGMPPVPGMPMGEQGAPGGPDTIGTGALPPGQEPINMPLPGGGPGSGQRMA